jgi:hypothetical protein
MNSASPSSVPPNATLPEPLDREDCEIAVTNGEPVDTTIDESEGRHIILAHPLSQEGWFQKLVGGEEGSLKPVVQMPLERFLALASLAEIEGEYYSKRHRRRGGRSDEMTGRELLSGPLKGVIHTFPIPAIRAIVDVYNSSLNRDLDKVWGLHEEMHGACYVGIRTTLEALPLEEILAGNLDSVNVDLLVAIINSWKVPYQDTASGFTHAMDDFGGLPITTEGLVEDRLMKPINVIFEHSELKALLCSPRVNSEDFSLLLQAAQLNTMHSYGIAPRINAFGSLLTEECNGPDAIPELAFIIPRLSVDQVTVLLKYGSPARIYKAFEAFGGAKEILSSPVLLQAFLAAADPDSNISLETES